MEQYINKSDLIAEMKKHSAIWDGMEGDYCKGQRLAYSDMLSFLDSLEVKEVDVDKMCEFKRCAGFAYPENASDYQKHLFCYRQGIEDVLKAQKGE